MSWRGQKKLYFLIPVLNVLLHTGEGLLAEPTGASNYEGPLGWWSRRAERFPKLSKPAMQNTSYSPPLALRASKDSVMLARF